MRTLVLLDSATVPQKQAVEAALVRIRDDYAPATPVTWEYEVRDFSNLPWVDYQPGAKGVSFDTVNLHTQAIFLRDGEKWDNVIYVIDRSHWQAPNIGGWNLGSTHHGYCVELVLAMVDKPDWLYKTFAMEIAHSWNDECMQEINDPLLTTFGVSDFDNQVVHGVDTRYGVNVPPNAPMTGYYTDYNYRPMIAICKDKLALAYKTRLDRFTNGAYKFFRRNLYLGLSGDDVVELQRRFAREGVAAYKPTGYFGPLTKASAVAYQLKKSIKPAAGFVGEITRLALNGTASPTQPPSGAPAEADAVLLSELAIWDSAQGSTPL
jgi:hypothetical protein